MSILIRSQDKQMTILIDSYYCIETYYDNNRRDQIDYLLNRNKKNKQYTIRGFISSKTNPYSNDFILGYYSSEGKAKKVLDMINNRILAIDKSHFLGCENASYKDCIFVMPQDDEVKV